MSEQDHESLPFPDRRRAAAFPGEGSVERRQFGNSLAHLSPGARELGSAIDRYKLENRRRFVTYEEMYEIITKLGYAKTEPSPVQKQA
ncbi:MAG TPA: hypothetical protein DCQ98_02890 [Planctomycetaceae bacterium]|nr:hypothetical protein [Planctomycetaceae bacterium]HRF01065.1 hypothetical protein [Pirellulaceae bacterium]